MATITVKPNPVLILFGNQSKIVKITWDTESTALGKVYLSIDGKAETVFDGDPAGKRSGSKSQRIELGKTYHFRLKRVPQNTELTSLHIKGEESLGIPAGLLSLLQKRLGVSQHIYGLQVMPGIDSVRFRFRLRQVADCFIEIKNENTRALTAFVIVRDQRVYDISIDRYAPYLLAPLEHDKVYSFRIVASAAPGSLIPGEKEVTGLFRTGGRSATVFFDRVLVHNDGDPGTYGAGDFSFDFFAGDVVTGTNIGNHAYYDTEGINSGEFLRLDRYVIIDQAPARLWVLVTTFEDDLPLFHGLARGTGGARTITNFAPPGSTCIDTGDGPYVEITEHFDLSTLTDVGGGEISFELSNGRCPILFSVYGRVKVDAHPGALLQASMKRGGSSPRLPIARVATLLDAGERVVVGTGVGRSQMVRLATGGAVHVTEFARKPAAHGAQWLPGNGAVTGPVTVVASGEDRVDLFALGPNGAAMQRALLRNVPANDEWETLGGTFVGPIAAATGTDDRVELFGLSAEGMVFHRTLSLTQGNQTSGEWQIIGEGVGGSLNAVALPQGGVMVVALSREGTLLHKRWDGNGWQPDLRRWQSLGAVPAGHFFAELIDDVVVLGVLAEDETVHVLYWRNYPEPPPADGWQPVATINTLLDSRLSLINAPVEANQPDSATTPNG